MIKSQYINNIPLKDLSIIMLKDPFYGVKSEATQSIINSIYRDNANNTLFPQPPLEEPDGSPCSHWFNSSPCSSVLQHHLVYLWCGAMGLPAYRNKIRLEWDWMDFRNNWDLKNFPHNEKFEIRLDELKSFLRQHSWSLPYDLFPNELDNTKRKFLLSEAEYEIGDKLGKINEEIKDWEQADAPTVEQKLQRRNEIQKLKEKKSELKRQAEEDICKLKIKKAPLITTDERHKYWEEVVARCEASESVSAYRKNLSRMVRKAAPLILEENKSGMENADPFYEKHYYDSSGRPDKEKLKNTIYSTVRKRRQRGKPQN